MCHKVALVEFLACETVSLIISKHSLSYHQNKVKALFFCFYRLFILTIIDFISSREQTIKLIKKQNHTDRRLPKSVIFFVNFFSFLFLSFQALVQPFLSSH